MTILLMFLALGCLFFFIWIKTEFSNEAFNAISGVLCVIAFLVVLIMMISIPICRDGDKAFIVSYWSFRETIDEKRSKLPEVTEEVVIFKEILEWNKKIAIRKEGNRGQWDWWTIDEIEELEPIK